MSDLEAFRCCHEKDGENMFCPPEGCPKEARDRNGTYQPYGCARDHGWNPGEMSPRECRGLIPFDPND